MPEDQNNNHSETAGHLSVSNKYVILGITMVANFFNPFTGSAVNIALPRISAEFGLNAVMMSWVTMAYLLSVAVFLLPMGKVADQLGRKSIYVWGNLVFMLASFVCGFSGSGTALIVSRLLQGIGGSMMVATSMAILMSAFEPHERGKVIGLNVASVYLGLSSAPVLGGLLTQYLGWRSLFIINGGVSVIVALAIILALKTEWKDEKKSAFDWKGALIYIPSMTMMMYGFSKLPETSAIILLIAGIIGLVFFVMVELKVANPVLEVAIFRKNLVFTFSNISAFINYAATFAVSFLLSLYLQYAKGLSPRDAGMFLMVQPVLMAIVSVFSGRISDKINPKVMSSIGMSVSVVGLLVMSFLTPDSNNIMILSALGILGLGFGIFSSPNTNVVMSSVPHKYYGVASATLSTMRNIGMMFSMALATLAVHVFVGEKPISADTVTDFMKASKIIFLLFTFLCTIGVFTSLSNTKRKVEE